MPALDYRQALTRLYSLEKHGMRLGLVRVRTAARALGDPQRSLFAVQVAGTNGKGSVATMLDAAARHAGLRTGLFISPHVQRYSERIRVNGEEASQEELARRLGRIFDLIDSRSDLPLTFFETTTLAAMLIFAEAGVELAVLEVGLGGRLDATSIAEPEVCVLTSVGLDHTDLLGETLEEIAAEKAAIARPGKVLVTGRLDPRAFVSADWAAYNRGASLLMLGRDFETRSDLPVPWPGRHQKENATVALEAFRALAKRDPRLTDDAFIAALPSARQPCRFEFIGGDRGFLLDGAHNLEATWALVDTLEEQGLRPEAIVFGALRDKPAEEMLEVLRPRVDSVVLVKPPIDRARDPSELAHDGDVIASSVSEALAAARTRTNGAAGLVLVTGSFFVAGEARKILLGEPSDPPIGM